MEEATGIQTLLMTDVVGSTRLWSAHPADMGAAVERMEAVAAEAVAAEGGRVVKARGEGDSLFCLMPHPAAAARAAVALVQALAAEPFVLTIRAAVHCGPAQVRGEDLYGPVPNRCARLREVGHPGQIVLSGAARAQISPSDGLVVRELGRHRLRDLDEPDALWQVGDETHPPLRSLTSLRNNLPTQPTAFVGREALRRDLLASVEVDRLTTLTGAGGSGKTRLALQLGAESIEAFPDGVWFVALAEVTEEPAIVRAVGEACGIRDLPEGDVRALADRLRGRALFLLDNAEHALAPIGRVVSGLMAATTELRFVVTSREPLRLRGERNHRVPPLGVPPPGCDDPEQVASSEAGALFLDRARLHLPEFALRASNALAVAEIVHRLDGIPLCLEMAASHVGYLGVDQIAARLHDRFALLEGDDADAPPRHRTMRETIAWQYEGLADAEKLLLQRLAAFAGTFALDAAEAVGGAPPLDPDRVLRHLRALVDKSLVVAVPDGGEMRYRLLETIAQFASDQPEGATESAMAMLVDWSIALIHASFSGLYGPSHERWVRQVDASLPSIYRALDWALAVREVRIARPLYEMTRYWLYRRRYYEAQALLQRALTLKVRGIERADLLDAMGVFYNRMGDQAASMDAFRQALEEPELEGAKRARCLCNMAIVCNDAGRLDEARDLYEAAIELAERIGEPRILNPTRFNLSLLFLDLGQLDQTEEMLEDLKLYYQAVGDRTRLAMCHEASANLWIQKGDVRRAAQSLAEVWSAVGMEVPTQVVSDVLIDAAWIAAKSDELERATFLLECHVRLQKEANSSTAPRKLVIEASVREALKDLDRPAWEGAKAEAHSSTIEGLLAQSRIISMSVL